MWVSKTLLVIDDDDDIREIAQLTLELGTSWRVLTASSGADGVDAAKQFPLDGTPWT